MGEKHTARPLRLIGRFLRRSWQGLLVGLLAIALGVAAFLSPGLVEADVLLDDGNAYVIKRDTRLIGTLNSQIKQLSNAGQLGEPQAEVLQNESDVLMYLPQSGSLVPFDAARNISGSLTKLPANSTVQLVRDRLLVVGAESGAVWSGSVDDMLAMDFEQSKPDLEVGENGHATLTTDGDVIGLDVNESRLVRATDQGVVQVALPFELEPDAVVTMSAVGDLAVVLDHSGKRLWVEGTNQALPVSDAPSARLMAPAPDALGGEDGTLAIYANTAGLNAVTRDGQESISSRIDLAPVTPVQVGDCVYGAGVSGTEGIFVRRCAGQEAQREEIKSITSDGRSLTFQVNRGVVTLNDQADGTVWMVDKGMFIIHPEDWEGVQPAEEDDPENDNGEELTVQPERSPENRAPTANDDALGARAGRSTVLNLLDNDSDPDGDVLTISTSAKLNGATLEPVRGGAGLQISIASSVPAGQFTFEYAISDGRPAGTDTATAVVTVHPADMTAGNTPPRKSDKPGGHQPIDLKSRTQLTKRVLLDWRDPEGDPLILKKAWLEDGSQDVLTFSPDGTIDFIDVGLTTGQKKINLTVSDGVAETTDALILNVVEDPVAPIAYGDYVTTKAGAPVEVEPLANDQAQDRAALTEVGPVEACEECRLDKNLRDKSFTMTAQKPGTYYVPYSIVDGVKVSGVVRIDVRGEKEAGLPVAASDVALLPVGGTVVLDPLLNDTDPNGEVLVVQTFEAPPSLQVVMERRHRMTISAKQELKQPVTFTYWISNGQHPVSGKITVVPTDIGSSRPIPADDRVLVRAGTTAALNPVANDTSPVGLDLALGELGENPFGERAWIDGDRVRISVPAGAPAGVNTIGYTVVDSRGEATPGLISVEVVPVDGANTAPAPGPVIDRVLAGTETRIAIPLNGSDANGDAVRLVGLASGPELGRVTSVGEEYLTYEAFEGGRGTDTFTYRVIDALGAEGVGEVRIGVAPPSQNNTKPVAQRDEITVRPGRPVQLSALRNDSDADGDSLGYDSETAVEMDAGIEAEVVENEIVLTAPTEPDTYAGTYAIQDRRGERAYGELIVEVVDDAENLAPIARDDSVPLSGIIDQGFVEIDPLANDYDPDGLKDDLRVEIPGSSGTGDGARVDEEGRRITVPVRSELQQVRYVLVDGDGARTTGIVIVPGTNSIVPTLIEPGLVLKPTAGQPFKVDVNRYVRGTNGRSLRLSSADRIWAAHNADAGLQGEDSINYVADSKFAGDSSLVFEVQDKTTDPNDKTAKTAVISIPLDVVPAAAANGSSDVKPEEELNQPPVATVKDPRLEVGAGEEQRSLNLLSLFRDPDGEHDSMAIKGRLQETGEGDAQINWSSEGDMLTASAPDKSKPGGFKTLSGVVMDGAGAEVPFTVTLVVTASTRPTVTAKADVIENAVAGQKYIIPVTLNDKSHLLTDQSVTLISARATSSGGSVRVTDASKGEVEVVLDKGWHGPFTATYYVNDATGDPNRQVTGTITAQVRDVPGTPSTPYTLDPEIRDGQVTVQYRSTGDGGARILGAVATASAPGQSDRTGTCSANTCTVTGLRNGVAWQVSVVETNEVGPSQPSGLSAAQTPDARPNAPTQPTIAYEDGALTASWTHDDPYSSPNGGSPIVGYDVTIAGGADGTVTLGAGARSHRWDGLTNGTTYTFTVTAKNQSGLVGTSTASVPEYPSGTPTGDTAPVARPIDSENGGSFEVTFSTSGVDARGDAVKEWIVVPRNRSGGNSANPVTVRADGSASHTVVVGGMGLEPTRFMIQAVNRGPGIGEVGATGSFQVAYPQPRITGARWIPRESSVEIVDLTTNLPREAPFTYEYSLDGGDWHAFDGKTISGLTNGATYVLRLRLVLTVDGATRTSETWRINAVIPRSDQPPAPQVIQRTLLIRTSEVRLTFDESLQATQGWQFADYRFCLGARCRPSSNTPPEVPADRSSTISWAAGSVSGQLSESTAAIAEPSLNASGTVSFSFPHVQSGVCTVTAHGETGQVSETVNDASGMLTMTRTFNQIPIPNPPSGGPTTETAIRATVECTVNGQSRTWTLD